ncbi:hypothetical protein BHM03_00049045 [Ensete ventricosum]|nr:hypothetical protein BHM03_00049045 [Ensete ventricosum]
MAVAARAAVAREEAAATSDRWQRDGYGEEVRQHWIRRLAAAVVEMQGKEGTIESKGRKGCSDSGTVVAGRRKIKLRLLSRRRGGDDSDWRHRKQRWCRYASVPKKELPAVASAEALVRVSWVGLRLMSLSVEKSGWR